MRRSRPASPRQPEFPSPPSEPEDLFEPVPGFGSPAFAEPAAFEEPVSAPRRPPVALRPKPRRRTSDYLRKTDPTHRQPYYESVATGESSWHPPDTGTIECVDEASGHAFFECAATGATAWTIEELPPVGD